jgi:hypothetical protein
MELNEVVAKIEEILDRYIDPEVGGDHAFIMYEVRRMSRQLQEAQGEVERLKLAESPGSTATYSVTWADNEFRYGYFCTGCVDPKIAATAGAEDGVGE